jgi:signal transduction histidine kinase
MLHDISERQELDSRREQLISTIGHDLRNPVSAVYGFGELVEMYGPLTADQKRFMDRLKQTTQKIQSLVYGLVDLAWVESGMPLENVPVALDKVIQQAVAELDREARQKRMGIAISTQQPMPVVMGDPLRLKQVIRNLLQNAIMYSEPEQPIAIHAYRDGQQVKCSVADRGIGIAETEVDQVFDRTFRSPDEAVRSLPGGGIGLTMARVIIRRHGGTIEVSSVLGRGSTFTFTLPLTE